MFSCINIHNWIALERQNYTFCNSKKSNVSKDICLKCSIVYCKLIFLEAFKIVNGKVCIQRHM